MKKIINTLLVVVLLSAGSVAYAETGRVNASATSTNARSSQSIKDILLNRRDHRWSKMVDRIEKAITWEDSLVARINSRIAKVKTAGGNTTDAEKFVSDATVQLDAAKTGLENLKALAADAITKEDAGDKTADLKNDLIAMRKAVNDIKKNLIEAHRLLQKVVGNLRGLSGLNNASSTKSN